MELLSARGITKFYPSTSVLANDGIDLSVAAGEILALVGENGAGKSTFARIVAGLVAPDSGEVSVRGKRIRPGRVRAAEGAGIGLVPQHSFLAETLRLSEALSLGREPRRLGLLLDRGRAWAETAELGARYGFGLDPDAVVGDLSPAERRHAEILRVLAWGGDLILLDEPTSLLTESETETLFGLARNLAAHGKALVFITHRVAELRAIATRIAVLREGRLVADRPAADFSEKELAGLMSRSLGPGPAVHSTRRRDEGASSITQNEKEAVAEARGLVLGASREAEPFSFFVSAGECLAIVALAGNGLDELESIAAGLARPLHGSFFVDGQDLGSMPRSRLRAACLGYVPSDREGRGLALDASVADNLIVLERLSLRARDWLVPGRRAERAARLAEALGPRSDGARPAFTLSGGNRQRLLLSRELGTDRPFLLLADPSQGLDLEGRQALEVILADKKREGVAILLLSSSIEEATRLADRVAVMYRGGLVWEGANNGPAMASELTGHLTGLPAGTGPSLDPMQEPTP
jgi:simple sugar transport system ATP-binding protein